MYSPQESKWTYPDGAENDAPVHMLELRYHALAYMLAFFLILGFVPSQCRQDSDTAPFGTFVECDEEFI